MFRQSRGSSSDCQSQRSAPRIPTLKSALWRGTIKDFSKRSQIHSVIISFTTQSEDQINHKGSPCPPYSPLLTLLHTPTMTGKVALITGITGQDGSYLTEFLLSKGYTVSYFYSMYRYLLLVCEKCTRYGVATGLWLVGVKKVVMSLGWGYFWASY